MISRKKAGELTGFRKPIENEKDKICRYFENIYRSKKRLFQIFNIIFVVMAIFTLDLRHTNGSFAVFTGLISIAGILGMIWTKRSYRKNIQPFLIGDFHLLEGKVSEISTNMEYPGAVNVRFQSAEGETWNMVGTVRKEGVQIDSPLLLVYAENAAVKEGISRVFTPYMLTDEGMKYRL